MSIKMIFASAAALALAAGTPAIAAKNQNQHAGVSEAGGSSGEQAKKICRSFKNTVSRVKRDKVCLTKAEWKKFEADQL